VARARILVQVFAQALPRAGLIIVCVLTSIDHGQG